MSLSQVVSYAWLVQVLLGLQAGLDNSILNKIGSGDIGVELCRPLSLYGNWFFLNMGKRLGPLFWRGVPTLAAGLIMPMAYRLQGPASLLGLLGALFTLLTACLLAASWSALICAVRMNVQWGNGPMHMLILISQILSGAFLPLQLWPDFLQKILLLQPFAGVTDLPLRLYLGILQPSDILWTVALQLLWISAFIGLGAWLMGRKLKNIVVQGG